VGFTQIYQLGFGQFLGFFRNCFEIERLFRLFRVNMDVPVLGEYMVVAGYVLSIFVDARPPDKSSLSPC